MSSLVYYKNKQNGVTYVYENTSVWNAEKKACDCIRKCIGKLDPQTGDIIATGKRGLGSGEQTYAEALIIGTHVLFEKVAAEIGLKDTLERCFPQTWDKILTCAYYLLSEGDALCHCETWSGRNQTPYGQSLKNQRISELLQSLTQAEQIRFFKAWTEHRAENEYFALDITSVSSYSEQNEYVRNGYNRDGEDLPQINLCMLLGEESGLPTYFEVLPGSIKDVSALKNVVDIIAKIGAKKVHLVMDKGFYSERNIDGMYEAHYKFTIGVPFTVKWAKEFVSQSRDGLESFSNYRRIGQRDYFIHNQLDSWKGHRCYKHVFYDSLRAAEEYAAFLRQVEQWRMELVENRTVTEHKKYYDRYFIIKETPVRGRKIVVWDEAVQEFKQKTAGFFVILSNDIKEPMEALRIYRNKDAVEKGFDDMKNALDAKRLRVHRPDTMKGRMFVQFVSLAIGAAIRKTLDRSELAGKYTLPEIINELKSFQRITIGTNKKPIFTKLTKLQREILDVFSIKSKSYV
jgi:transposase